MPDEMTNPTPDAGGFDIESILSGTSGQPESTTQSQGVTLQQGSGQAATEFVWGGRKYPTREAAEKAHNTLYGKYAEQQSIFNQLKAALKDPRKLAQFSKDPQWAPILAKLGIQQAEEDFEAQEEEAASRGEDYSNLPPQVQQFIHQQKVQAASLALDREEWAFERKLGRPVTNQEHDTVMQVIARAQDLTYEEAWKLAFHDKLLKEAHEKAAKAAPAAKGQRPPPIPGFVPGVKMDLKKPITDMTKAEFREHLKNSDEFKKLMSRE